MSDSEPKKRRGALPLSALVGRVIDPVAQQHGFATADLIAAWPDVVGARFASCTRPEKITWPRGEANRDQPGVLTLKVEGPMAVLVQHEVDQIVQRVNAFLGHGAVGRVRIVQGPVVTRAAADNEDAAPDAAASARLEAATSSVSDAGLRAALDRLGKGVLRRKQA
jgi:hypothetical protein